MVIGMILGFLLIGIPISAVLFRAGIHFANMILRNRVAAGPELAAEFAGGTLDDSNPYAAAEMAPGAAGGRAAEDPVPMPDFSRAYVICLVESIITNVVGFVIGFVLGIIAQGSGAATIAAGLLSGVVGFLLSALISSQMLPTTYLRALLVHLMQTVLVFVIAGAIIALVMIVL